jgi:hypothetical protein
MSLPPGAQREMFLEMANNWIVLAAKIENAALNQTNEVGPSGPYRFGSRFKTA